MVWWVLFLAVLSILSYLTDIGILTWLSVKVPWLNASLLSVLILLAAAGVLVRILYMRKKGRREEMQRRIDLLERKLRSFGSPLD